MRLGWLDELIDGTLSGESFDTTSLDVLRGVEEAIVLFGEERYEPIRARVLDYPDALRRAMVEAHLKLTPSWIYDGMGRDRGDLVVFYEYVLATMRNVVGILAGINGVYVAPEKLKRVGAVVGRMELTPPDAAARLDALLELPREQVRAELDDLVAATLDLVEAELPDVDTTRARALWSLPAEPSDAPLRPAQDVDRHDRVRVDEPVAQHRPFAFAHVGELEDRLLREHERVLVGGRAADEDRLAVAQADDDAALVEGSRVALLGADDRRADRGLCESVHGVRSFP